MAAHLVFYDGTCGFCDHVVQFILEHDAKEQFDFAPLKGETAKALLKVLPSEMQNADSLILIEDYKTSHPQYFVLGKGALRISWLMGGVFAIPGALSWLPAFFYDWAYRLVAKNRHRIFPKNACVLPLQEQRQRFLP